jgi:hypothetical protein
MVDVNTIYGTATLFSLAVGIGGFGYGLYCRSHESPKLRNEREQKEENARKEFQASQEATDRKSRETIKAMVQQFGVMMKETVASEVKKALEDSWRRHNPGKAIPSEVEKDFVASALSAIATLHEPIVLTEYSRVSMDHTVGTPEWVRHGPSHPDVQRLNEEPPEPKEELPKK